MKNQMSKYRRGLFVFITISLATLFILFISSEEISYTKLEKGLRNFNLIYVPIAIVTLLLHLMVDCFRLKFIARGVDAKMSFKTAWNATLSNEFLSAVTPFQSGGQPVEIYIFHRNGISLGKGVVISFLKTATSIIFLFLTAMITLFFYPKIRNLGVMNIFYFYGIIYFSFFMFITYLCIFKPNFAKKISFNFMKLLRKIRVIKQDKYYSKLKFIMSEVNKFNRHFRGYFFHKKGMFVLAILMTFLSWPIKYLVGYFVALGFGFDVSLIEMLLFQCTIHFVNYAIPTPGASATTEGMAIVILKFLTPIFDTRMILTLFIAFWRLFTYHLLIAIAGFFTFNIIRERFKDEDRKVTDNKGSEELVTQLENVSK